MVKIWVASRLKLPRSEVGGWCPTDWAMEFSHGPLTQVVKYICPSPTVCPCHHRVTCILTDLTVVPMSVLLVVLACHVDSCHSLLRDGVRSLSLTHGCCSHDIVDRYLLEISFDQWTRAVDLTGLQVAALGSSEVLLSDPVDASHLLVKSLFRSLGLTWGRCPHDIADSSLLKMTPELWSGLSIRCLLADICPCQVFSCFDRWWKCFTNTWMLEQDPDGMVYVVELLCGGCSGWAHATRFLQCPCQWLQLMPWTWVMSVFLPTSPPSASLVGSGLSVWLAWWWLLATRACHWVRGRDRTVHKFAREWNALSRTNS